LLLTANLIHCLVESFYNMEFIKCDLSIGQILFNSLDKGWRHIAADIINCLRIAAMIDEIILKSPNGSVILAFCGKDGF